MMSGPSGFIQKVSLSVENAEVTDTKTAFLLTFWEHWTPESIYEPEGRTFESCRAHHSPVFALWKIRSKGFLYVG
jgi:hypothetical protein